MREGLVQELSEREERAWQKSRKVREMVGWLRLQAAAQDDEMFWYVVRTKKPNADSVADAVREQGITVCCPTEKVVKRVPRRHARVTVERPLYARYFFVRLVRFEAAWLGMMTFDGVDCLLGNGEIPQSVPERFIAKIQAGCADELINKSNLFRAGDRASVTFGPFASFEGIVSKDEGDGDTVDIEIDIFGRMTPCRVGIDHLKKLA